MNEQERLERIIDILTDNAHEMCYVENGSENTTTYANIDGVQTVAREVCNVFRQVPKDTRSKREQLLDAQFEHMGIKPRVYHFTEDIATFNVVTVALAKQWRKDITEDIVKNCVDAAHDEMENKATFSIAILKQSGIYGVAICDRRDVFNKRYGRMKAKGRLLQHLLEEEKLS